MNIQLIIEVLGTIAFAISGAMPAIDRKMEYAKGGVMSPDGM